MKNRYSKITFEADEGITFEVREQIDGSLVVRAMKSAYELKAPYIPKGFDFASGEIKTGFVIKRLSDGSEFVWIPVGILDANATLDGGISSNVKFGRTNFNNDIFAPNGFHEEFEYGLKEQALSVEKYGGFYISRHLISIDIECKLHSVFGQDPYVDFKPSEAIKKARMMCSHKNVSTHVVYGAEYDCVLNWLMKVGKKKKSEICEDSSSWGNYDSNKMNKTGDIIFCRANSIYDLAGNVSELTQERYGNEDYTIRGGSYKNKKPVSYREAIKADETRNDVGFRVALWIS